MNVVQPIRDIEKVRDMERFLGEKNKRDGIMFILGIYTGLRISDILSLRVRDLRGKDYLTIKEKKTAKRKKNKQKRIKLNPYLKRQLKDFLKEKNEMDYVIQSRVGPNKAISRERAYAILREAAEEFGLEAVGCHTMRKTFGYHFYQRTKDIALLQKIFNHSSPEITLSYIGLVQDTIDNAMDRIRY